MMNFDEINAVLNQMADEGIVEPMVEPIDDPNVMTDFYDWAEVVGITDQIEPDVTFTVEN